MKKQKASFITISVLFVLLFAAVLVVFTMKSPDKTKQQPKEEKKISSEAQSENPKKTPADYEIENEKINALFMQAGAKITDLKDANCRQLITVESEGSTAKINCYSLVDNKWIVMEELSCQGFVGFSGTTNEMQEGKNSTPIGLFSVSDAFYINEKPETNLNLFRITNNTYWVDDPASAFYNKRIEGTDNKDWNSAEHMIDSFTSYEYGFVIDYNIEAVYNAGSAIFFHISDMPTAGCVGTSKEMVLKYLSVLDKNENPYILIV